MLHNITSNEAWDLIEHTPDAIMIDVRSEVEWSMGTPDLSTLGKDVILCSIVDLKLDIYSKNIFFICRSGVRSGKAAALYHQTFPECNIFNIKDGFEGNISGKGWKSSNLPWK